MNVLVLMANYLPGFKAGGPIRSVSNLVASVGDEINFHIIARDRDLGSNQRYETISRERWQTVGKAQVAYVRSTRRPTLRLLKYAREVQPDVLYINSFFNPRCCGSVLSLMRCGLLKNTAVVLAPHGEFSPGALAIRPWKKRPYLAAIKSLGLARHVRWHATSEPERRDIERVMGREARIVLAPNLCDPNSYTMPTREPKQPGHLRLVFLSRILPNKNLLGAIQSLQHVDGEVQFDIWGPIEDQAYWRRCQEEIRRLPPNIQAQHRGLAQPEQVRDILAKADGLLLPTHTENFGYAIVEAFSAGCPVVISDRTPWRDLANKGVGWDVPLDDAAAFRRAINELASFDEAAHSSLRCRAAAFGAGLTRDATALNKYRTLFAAPHPVSAVSNRAA